MMRRIGLSSVAFVLLSATSAPAASLFTTEICTQPGYAPACHMTNLSTKAVTIDAKALRSDGSAYTS